ncbi:hypothetical protein MATL_G00105550 [Megalops atlanticus]|uniref:Uncharacterized protein n=1 Tax=Megalops atlanticus TaxID=7932 RepID=A0A9D3Q256_MEGAT|nr:hypothetical protein MATL_G00105550 [Megalops atlanticus]
MDLKLSETGNRRHVCDKAKTKQVIKAVTRGQPLLTTCREEAGPSRQPARHGEKCKDEGGGSRRRLLPDSVSGVRFRFLEIKMSSARCLHHILLSVSILLAVTFGTSSISNPLAWNIPENHNATSSDPNGTTTLPPTSTQSGSISPTVFPSSTQLNVVTTAITQDSTSNSTVTATNLPGSTKESFYTTETSLNSTSDDPNAMATTVLPKTTALAHTTGFTTPSNLSTNQPQPVSTATSTSASTSQGDNTTLTATSIAGISTTAKPPPSITTNSTTQVEGKPHELSYSEKAMTIFFSVLLGVAILAVVVYSLTRCRREGTQFMHRPLYNNSEEPGEQLSGFSGADRFKARDDTLVISGGLYDGPEVFNPTMTTEEDVGFHSDQLPFAPGPAQFRLEFLPEERERSPNCMASTFETFQPLEDEP